MTGRYKILHSSHGTVRFMNGVVEEGGEKFLLFLGRNPQGEIAAAEFAMETGDVYEIGIPERELFLVSTPVDEAVPEGAVSLEGIRFYDAQGRDRTEELDRSSGRIAGRE